MRNFDIADIGLGSDHNATNFDNFLGQGSGGAYLQSSMLSDLARTTSSNFNMQAMEMGTATGIDALFEQNPTFAARVMERAAAPVLPKSSRLRLASVKQLAPFMRVSSDTLIHKSNRDLWALRKESDGAFYIERLFNDNGQPLKG